MVCTASRGSKSLLFDIYSHGYFHLQEGKSKIHASYFCNFSAQTKLGTHNLGPWQAIWKPKKAWRRRNDPMQFRTPVSRYSQGLTGEVRSICIHYWSLDYLIRNINFIITIITDYPHNNHYHWLHSSSKISTMPPRYYNCSFNQTDLIWVWCGLSE